MLKTFFFKQKLIRSNNTYLQYYSFSPFLKQTKEKAPVQQPGESQQQYQFRVRNQIYGQNPNEVSDYHLPHKIWTEQEVMDINFIHKKPMTFGDKFAKYFIKSMRVGFDVMSGYKKIFPWQSKQFTEKDWINRCIFLETVAGVPGFVAAMHRHMKSLRSMERDYGWIQKLLEEAENERVHLHTFLTIKEPSKLFRLGVIVAQVWYVALFSLMYVAFPRVSHRVVGYLEEEAVKTYTECISKIMIENSPISHWKNRTAPEIAILYWNLEQNATMLDVIYAIRKDEENHRDVNHYLGNDYTQQKQNPFQDSETKKI